ncbi:hypothetical protein [Nostoc sp. UHCC 0251]|uniref:hypothetical protein n=1 Tax=Nostoc sp. UHCC 0251 TaxID=3110240 RepID=UPI002B1EA14C|nr:hypothetical protein [Nostoc sp. UHCC 0251]MEA5626712.1 hypothetical protein [Nostoc sp. UHCC 0251]
MRHRLGLRAVLMDLMAGVEIKGDEAMIQTLAEFSKRNTSHVKGILNLTIPLSESPVWILGQYLWQLGLSTESRRPLKDGQRVRYYRLNWCQMRPSGLNRWRDFSAQITIAKRSVPPKQKKLTFIQKDFQNF